MENLPDYQHIEDAYRGVQAVISRLPKSTESERAKANLEIAQKLTYEARERAKADDRVSSMATGGPVTAGVPYMVGEQGPEVFVSLISVSHGYCSFPTAYCSCGARG